MDPIISIRHVSKAYRMWGTPSARIAVPFWELAARAARPESAAHRLLTAQATKGYRDFYALRDVSFQVPQGECLGIIGRNGSGKSTLLQLIAGTLQPTAGDVGVRGRVAALLELGSGFNPEFTGRENVYLNASILGLTRADIDARMDDILAFAEIGDFIDEPVKVYSSGMSVRLAFAVVAHVNADILIIDEALSVGDARFQLKCARAIDRFHESGVTLLFVSHDLSMVKRLCGRVMLLEQGRLIVNGRPNSVVNIYSKLLAPGGSVESIAPDVARLENSVEIDDTAPPSARADNVIEASPDFTPPEAQIIASERAHTPVSGKEYSYGGELGRICEPVILGENGEPRSWFTTGERVTIRMDVEAAETIAEPIYTLTVKDRRGLEVYGTNTLFSKQTAPLIRRGEKHRVTYQFAFNVIPGHYFISLGWTHFVGSSLVVVHRRYDLFDVEVHAVDGVFGIANLWAKIDVTDSPS